MEGLVHRVSEKGGCTVLLKDRVACSGSFLVHYFLRKLLSNSDSRVVLLGFSYPFTHYNRIARKQGCNLQACQDKGRFMFLDLNSAGLETSAFGWDPSKGNKLSIPGEGDLDRQVSGHRDSVRYPQAVLYSKIRDVASTMVAPELSRSGGEQTCIIIDDASILDIITGGYQYAVIEFLHYCRALRIGKERCSVILLTHGDIYEEPPDIYIGLELEHVSDVVLSVEALSTGLATDVHGQLTINYRAKQYVDKQLQAGPVPRFQRFQFRILENTVQFFLPGHR